MTKVYILILSLFFVFGTLKVSADNKEQLVDIKGNPDKFELNQNYPNPFNPTTTIRYTLPEKGKVTLRILDITGKELTTLLQKEQEQGEYFTNWNAQSLASGTYLYELFFEGKSGLQKKDVKKMVLVK